MRTTTVAVAALAVSFIASVTSLDNLLAKTPQMGWNSWNNFGCSIDENLIKDTAQAMVSTGLLKAGYNYVNMDDCWQLTRDSAGRVRPDPAKFPSGIFNLASEIHALGFKFGLYSSAGNYTCQGRPGGLNHEVMDALVYAAWGVDYLKYDNCYNDNIPPRVRYPIMRDALNATGRPILYSLCEWGDDNPATWAATVGNSWRTTGDINSGWDSILGNADASDQWWKYAGPGHWNDPDMLEVGRGTLSHDQNVAHFSLWALIKSPLILGNDIRSVTQDVLDIITNPEVIAVSQDALGVQGHKRTSVGGAEVWAGPLADGSAAVLLLNRAAQPQNITVQWTDIDFPASAKANVRDLWQLKDVGQFTGSFSAKVNSNASVMIKVTPTSLTQLF